MFRIVLLLMVISMHVLMLYSMDDSVDGYAYESNLNIDVNAPGQLESPPQTIPLTPADPYAPDATIFPESPTKSNELDVLLTPATSKEQQSLAQARMKRFSDIQPNQSPSNTALKAEEIARLYVRRKRLCIAAGCVGIPLAAGVIFILQRYAFD